MQAVHTNKHNEAGNMGKRVIHRTGKKSKTKRHKTRRMLGIPV